MLHSVAHWSSGKSKLAEEHLITIARDFSETPAGRYKPDGPFTGQHFRDDILIPSLQKFPQVTIDLDGVAGLPSSFWEESLGGLVRNGFKEEDLRKKLVMITTDPDLQVYIPLAWKFIREAELHSKANH